MSNAKSAICLPSATPGACNPKMIRALKLWSYSWWVIGHDYSDPKYYFKGPALTGREWRRGIRGPRTLRLFNTK